MSGFLFAFICVGLSMARLANLPKMSQLEVVGEVPIESPACIEGLLFYDVSLPHTSSDMLVG
jgi:hypothetical protein